MKRMEKSLPILVVDEICTAGNSLTMGNQILGVNKILSQPKDIVIASRMKDDTAPEYAFLHELGHILHIRLTHQYRNLEPPESFDVIQRLMFKRLIDQPKKIWAECFADCFAIASLYGTAYGYLDHTPISDEHKKAMCAYIQILMDTYKDNTNGRCSFDELLKIKKNRRNT